MKIKNLWKNISLQSSWGWSTAWADILYNWASPTNFTLGDLPAWTNIAGLSLEDILEQMLVGYVEPTFSAFNLASFAPWTVREMWNPYTLSWLQLFTWATTTSPNVAINSLIIRDMTAAVDLWTWLANDGNESLNIGTVTFSPWSPTTTTQQWRIQGLDTNGLAFSRLHTVSTQFLYPRFYGKVNGWAKPTKNQALIASWTKVVWSSTGTIIAPFSSSASDWLWFAIPQTSTSKTTWFENALNNWPIWWVSNLFDTETIVSINSPSWLWTWVNYKIYVSNYQSAATTLELRN